MKKNEFFDFSVPGSYYYCIYKRCRVNNIKDLEQEDFYPKVYILAKLSKFFCKVLNIEKLE